MSAYYKEKWEQILSRSCAVILIPSLIHLVSGGMAIGNYDSGGINEDVNAFNIIMLFVSGIAHFAGSGITSGYIAFHTNIFEPISEDLYEKYETVFFYLFFVVPFASVIYGTSIYRTALDACYDQRRLFMCVFIVKIIILIISTGILIPEIVHRIKEDIHWSGTEVQPREIHVDVRPSNNIVIRNTYVSNTQMIQIQPEIAVVDVKIDVQTENDRKMEEEEEDKINYTLSLTNKNISTCAVCYKLRWMMVFSPCGHARCCEKCSITLSNNENRQRPMDQNDEGFRCPICRSNVDSYTKLYL
ncbi:MAG: RING-HC finger protein [Bacteroidetes bacterium]|nr:RING-HC finger protein [Bacteroidota bacterium]